MYHQNGEAPSEICPDLDYAVVYTPDKSKCSLLEAACSRDAQIRRATQENCIDRVTSYYLQATE